MGDTEVLDLGMQNFTSGVTFQSPPKHILIVFGKLAPADFWAFDSTRRGANKPNFAARIHQEQAYLRRNVASNDLPEKSSTLLF